MEGKNHDDEGEKMKFLVLGLLLLTSNLLAQSSSFGKYVYYEPDLTSTSAPFSFQEERRVRKRCCNCDKSTRRSRRVVRRQSRRVVYRSPRRDCGVKVVAQDCTCCKVRNCITRNNIVKEINGGAPRYVVNGSYKVCNKPINNGDLTDNYSWNWTRNNPYYMKDPNYLEKRNSKVRFNRIDGRYIESRNTAQKVYYYR